MLSVRRRGFEVMKTPSPAVPLMVGRNAVITGGTNNSTDANLFVSPSGNDSLTRDQVIARVGDWQTIQRAAWGSTTFSSPNTAQAAQPGDIVDIAAGMYTLPGQGGNGVVTLNPANSGTSTEQITFRGVGTVTLGLTSAGIAIGVTSRRYITWESIVVDDATYQFFTSGGLATAYSGSIIPIGIEFNRCTFIGRTTGIPSGNNYAGIFTSTTGSDTTTGLIVRNCTFRNFNPDGNPDENHAGIDLYYSGNYIIENNDFDNCGAGVYVKANYDSDGSPAHYVGSNSPRIRYNIFRNGFNGVRYHISPLTSTNPCLIYQNIFKDTSVGVQPHPFGANDNWEPRYCYVINNTFHTVGMGVRVLYPPIANANHLVQNNLFRLGNYALTYADEGTLPYSTDRIMWQRNLGNGQVQSFANFGGNNRSTTQWESSTHSSQNNSTDSVQFVDESGDDFRLLDNGQTARTLGRVVQSIGGTNGDTIPVGCYISGSETIGPQ